MEYSALMRLFLLTAMFSTFFAICDGKFYLIKTKTKKGDRETDSSINSEDSTGKRYTDYKLDSTKSKVRAPTDSTDGTKDLKDSETATKTKKDDKIKKNERKKTT